MASVDYRVREGQGNNIVVELSLSTNRIYLSVDDARALARKLSTLADLVEKHEAAIRAHYVAEKKP